MSVRSIYKKLKDSPILDETGIFSELFEGYLLQDAKAMNYIFKLAMNDRDTRITSFLMSTSKIHWVFSQSIKNKDEKIINFLLSNGIGIRPWRPADRTAIHQAVYCDYIGIIDLLFAHCDNSVNFTDVNGLSHLHAACISGNLDVVQHFLRSGVDPNLRFKRKLSQDKFTSITPLHLAVEYLHLEIVELLLSHGAEPDATDDFGLTSLHLACFRLSNSCIVNRENQTSDPKRQLDIVKLLLKHGSDVNAKDCFGNTPLLSIFQQNYLNQLSCSKSSDIVDSILIYQHDWDDCALQKGKTELLLDYRVDVRVSNDEGDNALHLLIKTMESLRRPKALAKVSFDDQIHVETANLLLKAGVSVNGRNKKRQSPLQLAADMLSLDMVELLLKYDASVNSIRFEKDCFCYCEDVIPSLEATENLLGIVDKLSSNGLHLDKRNNLSVMKFLVGNHVSCRYDVWTDRNASYKLKNLLELGTDENITAAFAKFPLDIYDTSFKAQSMKKQMVQQLHEHVTILEKGGFYMSRKIHKSLSCKISSLEKCILEVLGPNKKLTDADLLEFENEFQGMKATALSSSTSLHDMLTMSPEKIYSYIKNYNYKMTYLPSEEGKPNYSRSNGIMKGHFAKSLVRKYLSKSAIRYLRSLINLPLPDLCCEKIFDYLDNDNLLNLCVAATELDFEKRKKFKSDVF